MVLVLAGNGRGPVVCVVSSHRGEQGWCCGRYSVRCYAPVGECMRRKKVSRVQDYTVQYHM